MAQWQATVEKKLDAQATTAADLRDLENRLFVRFPAREPPLSAEEGQEGLLVGLHGAALRYCRHQQDNMRPRHEAFSTRRKTASAERTCEDVGNVTMILRKVLKF